MSKGNPDKAMAALLPLPIRVSGGYEVKPMTLGMFAALERIKSPLVNPDIHTGDMLDLIPSLYLLTHDPIEVFKADLIAASMAWADTVPPTILAEIQTAAYRQINAALDVVPEKKKENSGGGHDGWITALVYFAAEKLHWGYEEIMWRAPMGAICLLRRREELEKGKIFPLSTIEKMDNGDT